MKLLQFIVLFLIVCATARTEVYALYNPLSRENNKYGIHLADPNDISDAGRLVNSSGGSWGYVTIVIPETDRNTPKWQEKFDRMRRNKLIPLVRIAGTPQGPIWTTPSPESIRDWVTFLDSLRWPIENRYVIVYNEPNHAKEWGGTIDPEGYARVLAELGTKLKERNEDFFILPAGLDMSARSDGASLDGAEYLRRMTGERPEILSLIDGWTSHSYPNPGFAASPNGRGKGTIGSFIWEMDYLRSLGMERRFLPIFITETGWVHSEGKTTISGYPSPEAVAGYLRTVASDLWNDQRIVAITPFVFSYQDYPFDHFSFMKIGQRDLHPHAIAYQELPKTVGKPRFRHGYEFLDPFFPEKLVSSSSYSLTARLKNTGQATIGNGYGYELSLASSDSTISYVAESVPDVEPTAEGRVTVHMRTPEKAGTYDFSLSLVGNGDVIPLASRQIRVIPPPSLSLAARLGWRKSSQSEDVTVLIYEKDSLLHKFTGVKLTNGIAQVEGLTNIVPGSLYRVVMLVPYYLPRQEMVTISEAQTSVSFKRFLPVDFDKNGGLDLGDISALISMSPRTVWGLIAGD